VLDIRGRRVAQERLTTAGRHSITLGQGRRLTPGLYMVRLSQGCQVESARAAVLR
jgi:hypothetical protein